MQAESDQKLNVTGKELSGPIVCRRCGAKVPAGSRFCNMCGIMLQGRIANAVRSTQPATATQVVAGPRTHPQDPGAPKPNPEPAERARPAAGTRNPNVSAHLTRALGIIQGHQSIPAFSRDIITILGMGNDEASMRHLTNTIMRDYSLTLAVLRVANSAYYNRSGKPICGVARAVTMMGIEAIKRVASGLLLLEDYEKRPTGLKELLLLSMLTASHSRQLALRLQLKGAEEVYLCGMFRNLGEVLTAFYFGDLYQQILHETRDNDLSEHEACVKVTGFTYEDLGQMIADAWNLPGVLSKTMSAKDSGASKPETEEGKIRAVVALSHDLTHCVYRCPTGDTSRAIDRLLEKYGNIADLNRQEIQSVLAGAVSETKDTFGAAGLPLDDLQLRRQYQRALDGDPGADEKGFSPLSAATIVPAPSAIHPPASDEDLLNRLAAEVKAAIEPGHELKLNEVLMMVLEACHRGAGFDRVVFCLATPDRVCVRGRMGLGPSIEEVIERLQIPLSGREEPLSIALQTKRDIFVTEEQEYRYEDSQLVQKLGAACFGLCPVVVDNIVVGCLYFDRLAQLPHPPQPILDTIGRLRDLVAEMIGRNRAHS